MAKDHVCRDLLTEDKFNDDDEVLVIYKFKGTHKAHKIRCTYLQYKNLKSIPSVEYCRIIIK
ncbi:hypothetical protein DSQ19_03275 [Candidatus Nitrosotenuis sp. DW1]|nr:hypothetical protein DSQ19_03275 [Candidatus Nitrosotenuis sp. DW1]